MSKPYGLIIPKKNQQITTPTEKAILPRPSIFDEESDSEEESSKKPTGLQRALKKQDRVLQEKAIEEDPTIFQYDEVYDDIDQKRKESKLARNDIDRKPKYISKLLQAADRRKRENERRIEREVQRERDAEGEEFKDKESFVTTAYRKKLEEMKELEEKEKREEYLESIGDVRKQGNLDGFYRHLYDQKVNYGETSKDNKETVSTNEKSKIDLNDSNSKSPEDKKSADSPELNISKNQSSVEKTTTEISIRKKRKYRHRKQSGEASSDEEKTENASVEISKHIQSNLDADSDFSIDSGADDDEIEDKNKEDIGSASETNSKKHKDVKISDSNKQEDGKDGDTNKDNAIDVKLEKEAEEEKAEVSKKEKIDIWKKRTIGVVFDEALQRYFQRKAARESIQL